MCLKTPRLRLSDCSVGRSTSMSSFTRVATGPRLPHPARSESPPLVLAVVGAILVYSAPRPPPRQVDRPVAPTSPTLRATNRACARANETLAFRAPDRWRLSTFRRRPRPPHPRILSAAEARSSSAPSQRLGPIRAFASAPAARCPSFAGPPSPGSRVLSGKGHSASNRRSKRPSPLTTLPAASLHRILIAGCYHRFCEEIFGRDLVRDLLANASICQRAFCYD